jgi:hypothetical protein
VVVRCGNVSRGGDWLLLSVVGYRRYAIQGLSVQIDLVMKRFFTALAVSWSIVVAASIRVASADTIRLPVRSQGGFLCAQIKGAWIPGVLHGRHFKPYSVEILRLRKLLQRRVQLERVHHLRPIISRRLTRQISALRHSARNGAIACRKEPSPTITMTTVPVPTGTLPIPSITASPTPNRVPAVTPTATTTKTASPTVHNTALPTATGTAIIPSVTPSIATTATLAPSSTPTPKATATNTATSTATNTAASTATSTATATASPTVTATATRTPTLTPSFTPTRTATATATATRTPTATSTVNGTVDPGASLLMRKLPVVNDFTRTGNRCDGGQNGVWSFGSLLTAMAGNQNASDFVEGWLKSFATNQNIAGDVVPARPGVTSMILDAWPRVNGKLDLSQSPFRLQAILYRPDLRNRSKGSAGEGRFVFNALSPSCAPTDFMVILEYKLRATNCADTVEWANRFQLLKTVVGTAAFNGKLADLTTLFSKAGAIPSAVNGSGISQVRTIEKVLGTDGNFELREFRLDGSGQLKPFTVAITPKNSVNGTAELASFINLNESAILAGEFGIGSLIGGRATVLGPWNAPGITNPEARHSFGASTCNGCHSSETGTDNIHVKPRQGSGISPLSDFLTGASMPKVDPVNPALSHSFSDVLRRAQDLAILLKTDCSLDPTSFGPPPLKSVRSLRLASRSANHGPYCRRDQNNNPVGRYAIGRGERSPFGDLTKRKHRRRTHRAAQRYSGACVPEYHLEH